jgi:hypothetical protein
VKVGAAKPHDGSMACRPRGSANSALPDPRMFNKPPSGDKGLPVN